MTPILDLWLPIVVAGVFVFLVSSVIHMGPLWHRSDYPKLPNEDALRDAVRPLAIPPGDYMVPRAESSADMKSPAYLEKVNRGPVMLLTVMPNGSFTMGKSLLLWFVYAIIVSFFAAYIGGRALAPGAEYVRIQQMTGVTAFIGYALALSQMSIWKKRSWSLTGKEFLDGAIYAALTGGVFGWLWPS